MVSTDPTTPNGSAEPNTTKPAADEALSAQPRRVNMPPEPGTKLRVWGMLLLTIGLCLTPMLIELHHPHTTRTMEKMTLMTSQQTWTAQKTGDADAWWTPTINERVREKKPPMAVWQNMLAWADLHPDTASTDTLVLRARLMAVAMAVLTLAATYWAGYSIGGIYTAAMATMVAGTTYLLLKQARIATYDTFMTGWTTLSVAAGLWAIRPLKPVNWTGRRVAGWLLSGIALGAAVLTKGPQAFAFVGLPLLATVIVAPRRKLGNAIGLVFALTIGALLAAPWYLHLIEVAPGVWDRLTSEYQAVRSDRLPFYYYGVAVLLVFPWSVYFIGALFQPFVRARGEHRRRTLLGWLWFIVILAVLMIPDAKQYRYLLPLIPAVGVLVGQLWSYHAYLSREGWTDPGINVLRIPHWVVLAGGSIAVPAFLVAQPMLIERGWYLEQIVFPGLSNWLVGAFAVGLIALTVYGIVMHWRWKPVQAFAASALWMVLMFSVVQFSYTRSPDSYYAHRPHAERVGAEAGNLPVYYLWDPGYASLGYNVDQSGAIEPDEEFLFYARRTITPVSTDALDEMADRPCYVMVRLDGSSIFTSKLAARGYTHVFDFIDGRERKGFTPVSALYRSPAPLQ